MMRRARERMRVASRPRDWNALVVSVHPDVRCDLEERAAIREYCGGLERSLAERLTLEEYLGPEQQRLF